MCGKCHIIIGENQDLVLGPLRSPHHVEVQQATDHQEAPQLKIIVEIAVVIKGRPRLFIYINSLTQWSI